MDSTVSQMVDSSHQDMQQQEHVERVQFLHGVQSLSGNLISGKISGNISERIRITMPQIRPSTISTIEIFH